MNMDLADKLRIPYYQSNLNNSIDMLNYLLSQSADLKTTIAGLIWGKGYDWETLIPSVNPISYAMMGLLPQMHRREITISKIVTILLATGLIIHQKISHANI